MAQHRDDKLAFSISRGLILSLVLVLCLAVAGFAWYFLIQRSARQHASALTTCTSGDAAITVVADPAIEPSLSAAISRWQQDNPVVGSGYCPRVTVRSLSSRATLMGLRSTWDKKTLGKKPDVWIPLDRSFIAELRRKPENPKTTVQTIVEESPIFASTPLVLAVPSMLATSLRNSKLQWKDIPSLAQDPQRFERLGLAEWTSLRPIFPQESSVSASSLLAMVSDKSARVRDRRYVRSVRQLYQTASKPLTSQESIMAVANTGNNPQASSHSSPATEVQLLRIAWGGKPIAAWYPSGRSAVCELAAAIIKPPANIILNNQELATAKDSVIASLTQYLASDKGQFELLSQGLRAGDKHPVAVPGIAVPPLLHRLPEASTEQRAAVQSILYPMPPRSVR